MTGPNHVREMVHDLRNRLTAIASAAIAIRKSNFDPELSEEMVEIIRNTIDRATETLNGLSQEYPGEER
ncbi:histidine kinase dimerization/phospho-acceptor domain-containing protein [Tautonia sociabilis]|uniref:histidine kinase n=1 Tax=Tautonia sociabilis TaxID=2080755 RepID=A0A432MK53_9BACT|nr:histidine kinase dimerization/phospho-acceptor domain-containing protein [Tautonia sociabilis]RUL87782.1 hypothetical protein TsocGM_10490 [Tautonia sociabilis]